MFRLLFSLFLATGAYAETRTYLVKRAEHFPQDRYLITVSPQEFKTFIDTGKKNIDEAKGQPFRTTSYTLNFDGKYALWNVSFKDEDEKNHLDSMEKKGYIVLLSTSEAVTTYDPRIGGNTTEFVQMVSTTIPNDFYSAEELAKMAEGPPL